MEIQENGVRSVVALEVVQNGTKSRRAVLQSPFQSQNDELIAAHCKCYQGKMCLR